MAPRLFGTDGIRGRALEWPLDEDTVTRLGVALAIELRAAGCEPSILLAGDTRASTETLAEWMAASFQASGGEVTWGGVLPTPAVSQLLRGKRCAAGVVISASHNPADDNGIKVLGPGGQKIDDEVERKLEDQILLVKPTRKAGLPPIDTALAADYLEILLASHEKPRPLAGMHVVLDCANGAASISDPSSSTGSGHESPSSPPRRTAPTSIATAAPPRRRISSKGC